MENEHAKTSDLITNSDENSSFTKPIIYRISDDSFNKSIIQEECHAGGRPDSDPKCYRGYNV
jgi:hypothetical protein